MGIESGKAMYQERMEGELATLRDKLADEERKNTNLRHGLEEMEREKDAAYCKGYNEGLAYVRARLTEVEGKRELKRQNSREKPCTCGPADGCNKCCGELHRGRGNKH